MKKIVILFAALVLLLAACGKKEPELSLVTEDYPPLTFLQDGQLTGYGSEVVAEIQGKLGTNFQPQIMSWDKAYEKALSEPNVVIFTIEKTREREDLFYFVGPLGANTASFYIRKDSALEISDLAAAKALESIATTSNWFTELYLKSNGFTNLISKEDPKENIRMVMDGEAQASVFTDLSYHLLAEELGVDSSELKAVLPLMTTEYYIGISKTTDATIVQKWQDAFEELVAEGRIEELKAKWLPMANQAGA